MKQRNIVRAVVAGGLIAGALDIAFAIAWAGYNGMTPAHLLQVVASGALGNAAFSGGSFTAAVGLAFHFALSLLWAAAFMVVALRVPAASRHPLASGMVFGILVFGAMRLIVLPLSAFPFPVLFKPLATTLDLLSHMFLFGVPIAVSASRAVLKRQP